MMGYKNYLSVGNVKKNSPFRPNFNFSDQTNLNLALKEVKTSTFMVENLPPTFAFPPQLLPFPERGKGSKFEP